MQLLSPMITRSGWVYSVAAPRRPDQDIIGYPMYYPHPEGLRQMRGQRYHKFLRRISSANPWVQLYPPEPRVDPWAARIPNAEIIETIDVISSFQTWLSEIDPRKIVLERILRESNISISSIGLGGSTSLGCQQPDADIDIIIYGINNTSGCLRAIEYVLLNGEAALMSPDVAAALAQRYGELYSLPSEYLFHIFAQDLTKIYVQGKKISFIFTYGSNEFAQIPEVLYRPGTDNTVEFRARVVSSISSWYYPRKYLVQTSDGKLYSVWSHHWLHKAMALPGTLVEIVADRIDAQTYALSKLNHRILPLHG